MLYEILSTGFKEIDLSLISTSDMCVSDFMNKPTKGILFGSTEEEYIEDNNTYVTSGWNYYTSYDYDGKLFSYGVSYKLKDTAKILYITTKDDYIEVCKKYLIRRKDTQPHLNYDEIFKKYDAINFSEDVVFDFRYIFDDNIPNLYCFDSETWMIGNPDIIDTESIIYRENVKAKKEE